MNSYKENMLKEIEKDIQEFKDQIEFWPKSESATYVDAIEILYGMFEELAANGDEYSRKIASMACDMINESDL